MKEAAEPVESLLHVQWVNDELVDDSGEASEREIEVHRRVGSDAALDGRMRDVALVPQCHILQGWNDRRADETRKPGEILGKHWIALVGHRGGAFLAFRAELLRFQNFGPLKVPDSGRK